MIPLLLTLVAGPSRPAPKPRLVVVITVDQLRPDYLDRYRPQLKSGLAMLLKQGAVFTEAYHDHAITETAPGHATILSGRWPAHTGIIRNLAGVQDSATSLIGVTGIGASPARFRGTELFDWLKAAEPAARALSVSGKDRGAILPIGRAKEQVYWYVGGVFTTSRYYADSLPLGVRGTTDLLAVSLSTTDYIGHAYGPDSREIHDQVLRLDRYLGRFFEQLFVRYGGSNVLIVLTADHGVTPFPEHSRALGRSGAVRVTPDTLIQSVNAALDARAGGADWLVFESGMLMVPGRARLAAQGINVDSVIADVATRLRRLAGVGRVDRPADLAADSADPVLRRWRHQVPPDAGVELVVTLKPYSIWGIANVPIAMHGQPTDLDAHVPLIFWGSGVHRGEYGTRVRTVDIAPTLARLLDLTPAEPLDGRPLTAVLP